MSYTEDNPLRPLLDELLKIKREMKLYSKVLKCVVTRSSPLQVRLDEDSEPLEGVPETNVQGLVAGDRVTASLQNGRLVILGRAGGPSNNVLWTGQVYMNASQEIPLSEKVSDQETGIVLVWQAYVNGVAINRDTTYHFVPKWHVANLNGGGIQNQMAPTVTGSVFSKYVYVSDTTIRGYADNAVAPRLSHVLTAVLGV